MQLNSILNPARKINPKINLYEDLYNELKDKELKAKWKEIKAYRNQFQHEVEGEGSVQLPNKDKSKELKEINDKLDKYISWLKENKENILNDLKGDKK